MYFLPNARIRRKRISNVPDVRKLDPEEVFVVKYTNAIKRATGIERLAYSMLPISLMKSYAFAIDPFAKFAAGTELITPVNRTRTRLAFAPGGPRFITSRNNLKTKSSLGSPCPNGLYTVSGTPTVTIVPYTAQAPLTIKVYDTTTRTRPANSRFGEFELSKVSLDVPELSISVREIGTVRNYLVGCSASAPQYSESDGTYTRVSTGGFARYTQSNLDLLIAGSKSLLESSMPANALRMIPKTVPESRRFSAFRSAVELKDLPRSIRQIEQTLKDLSRVFSLMPKSSRDRVFNQDLNLAYAYKNIPKEYLSYHFGWKLLVKDVLDLLEAPKKITSDVNRLIQRRGKPTTWRTDRKNIPLVPLVSPAFDCDMTSSLESGVSVSTTHSAVADYRCVINAIFDFPEAIVPELRTELIVRKYGLYPSPTDFYNLIPWSWLVDWFTGLGNYIEAIDVINTDRSTINYGFMTGILRGQLDTVRKSKTTSITSTQILPAAAVVANSVTNHNLTARLGYTVMIRRSLGNYSGVRQTANPASLTLYQQSILGSILLSRAKGTRFRNPF